jgi:hypothetical protein
MSTLPASNRVPYRLVIIDPMTHDLLCAARPVGLQLPVVYIRSSDRLAAALTERIAQEFHLKTILLAVLPEAIGQAVCAILESLEPHGQIPHGYVSCPILELPQSELRDALRAAIIRVLRGQAVEFGRYARIGWLEDLRQYLRADLITEIHHINSGINFCLLSMNCDGRRLWFKGVGKPNTREYPVTAELARRFPKYLPVIVLEIPEWSAWVAEEVPGTALSESSAISDWEDALRALALLQWDAAEFVDVFSSIGAVDWTSSRLLQASKSFFADAETVMLAQTSTRAVPLTTRELSHLREDIELALAEIANSGIPNTLVHGDIGHGNVLTSPWGPVFLDWAESYIAHPFISAEHLIADLERRFGLTDRQKSELRWRYALHWAGYTDPDTLRRVVTTAPAIASFAYAVIAWETHRHRPTFERVWPLMRSMLRRTKHELQRVEVTIP